MNNLVFSELWKILKSSEPTMITFALGFQAVLWGLALLDPNDTFSIASFHFLATIAPEWLWGIMAVFCGMSQMIVVIRCSMRMRGIMGLCDAGWWTFIAIGMWLSHSSPVPTYQFVGYAILGLWAFFNVLLWRPRHE